MTIPHAILPAPRVTSEQVRDFLEHRRPFEERTPVTYYLIPRKDRRAAERAMAKLLEYINKP